MTKFSLLVLLSLASYAATWEIDSDKTVLETCNEDKFQMTEQIVEQQKKVIILKTKNFAPHCTSDYVFTYVKPETCMVFNSHRMWKTHQPFNCGWWFWTDVNHKFDVRCTMIEITTANLVILDIDNKVATRITGKTMKNAFFSFDSNDVAVGLELKMFSMKHSSYSCTITTRAAPPKPTIKTIVIGGFSSMGGMSKKDDLLSNGKIVRFPDLPTAVFDNGVVSKDKKIYSCGGYGSLYDCYTFDFEEKRPSWKKSLSLPVVTAARPTMAVGDNIWILVNYRVHVIPFTGGLSNNHYLPSGLYVGMYSCGGGDQTTRFVIPSGMSYMWVNTDAKQPGSWTKKMTSLGSTTYYRSCMLQGNNIYMAGGYSYGYSKAAAMFDLKTNSLTNLPDMNEARQYCGIGMLNDKVVVFGGHRGFLIDTMESYDEKAKKWEKLSTKLTSGKVFKMGHATFPVEDVLLDKM